MSVQELLMDNVDIIAYALNVASANIQGTKSSSKKRQQQMLEKAQKMKQLSAALLERKAKTPPGDCFQIGF